MMQVEGKCMCKWVARLKALTYRKSQMTQNIMDGLSYIRRVKIVVIWVPVFNVTQVHLEQKVVQVTLRYLFSRARQMLPEQSVERRDDG